MRLFLLLCLLLACLAVSSVVDADQSQRNSGGNNAQAGPGGIAKVYDNRYNSGDIDQDDNLRSGGVDFQYCEFNPSPPATLPPEAPVPTDTVAPIITINGDNPMDLTRGDTWTDPGATAVDDVDGALRANASGEVDVEALGRYTVVYTATDAAGNTATATRVVNVGSAPWGWRWLLLLPVLGAAGFIAWWLLRKKGGSNSVADDAGSADSGAGDSEDIIDAEYVTVTPQLAGAHQKALPAAAADVTVATTPSPVDPLIAAAAKVLPGWAKRKNRRKRNR